MRVTKQLRTETAHRLIDYDGRCAHLHGHSYLWEVTVEVAELTSNGMAIDFKDLKRAMNKVLDPLDHCLVLAPDDALWGFNLHGELPDVLRATNGENPRLIKWHENPTAESFAEWAAHTIQTSLHRGTVVQVRVWETATSYADWTKS